MTIGREIAYFSCWRSAEELLVAHFTPEIEGTSDLTHFFPWPMVLRIVGSRVPKQPLTPIPAGTF